MIPFPSPPPTIQEKAEATTLNAAVDQVLQDFDLENPSVPLRDPAVQPAERPSLRWLRSAALSEVPENPFAKGSDSFAEAEALLTLARAEHAQGEALLPGLRLNEPGTALALWKWARRQERIRPWNRAARRIWEDKLLARKVPSLLNGYALRHALCWALAEKDEARFAELKAAWGQESQALFQSLQGLFGWFGGISPVVRLWKLPGLDYRDQRLDELPAFGGGKADRIWIAPVFELGGSPPKLPARTAWIIPSATGAQDSRETDLAEVEKAAGGALSMSISLAKGQAYLAPSRTDFEGLGLMFFPILIKLDMRGAIQEILMGDAAPPGPG